MSFGKKIKELRKEMGLSQSAVAEKLGISLRTLQNYESGASFPAHIDIYNHFAKQFSVTTDYLINNNEQNIKSDAPNHFGFVKVACATPVVSLANVQKNVDEIFSAVTKAYRAGASILVTPELSLSGYTCGDLFFQQTLLQKCLEGLQSLLAQTADIKMTIIVGLPIEIEDAIYNCAAVLYSGRILGVVPKMHLANHHEYTEKRWFNSGSQLRATEITLCGQNVPIGNLIFALDEIVYLGIEICEDLWVPISPGTMLCLSGANLIVNPSASNEVVTKDAYRRQMIAAQSAACNCAYAFCNAGYGESTTDMVFGGGNLIYENGTLLSAGKRFEKQTDICYACIDMERLQMVRRQNKSFSDNAVALRKDVKIIHAPLRAMPESAFDRTVDAHPFIPKDKKELRRRCEEILSIQTTGLSKRMHHIGMKKCVIGISGGLDSTLALLVCVQVMKQLKLPSENVIGITMPGFGTTDRTYQNALDLMDALQVTKKEISIKDACLQHMKDIGHDPNIKDITYENTQARERTQILMDIANQQGALLVGTGDLSELAMGWCTYNGDHMSMYGVNAGIPKTMMQHVVETIAHQSEQLTQKILRDILDTPISPELLPPDADGDIAQKTEDKIGPYELHDFFLYYFFRFGMTAEKIAFLAEKAFAGRYSSKTIHHWLSQFLQRFFRSQFKRSCLPDGPKVGSVSLSPRGDWQMPSDADDAIWRITK